MFIRLFDVEDRKVIPTEHCYVINYLRRIIDEYPDNHCKIFAYLQFMSCPDGRYNPYLSIDDLDKETTILRDIDCDFDMDDEVIINALTKCKKMYETSSYRAWASAKKMVDRYATFLDTHSITTGREASSPEIRAVIKDLPNLRKSVNQLYKEMEEENNERIRGGADVAYDQQ